MRRGARILFQPTGAPRGVRQATPDRRKSAFRHFCRLIILVVAGAAGHRPRRSAPGKPAENRRATKAVLGVSDGPFGDRVVSGETSVGLAAGGVSAFRRS